MRRHRSGHWRIAPAIALVMTGAAANAADMTAKDRAYTLTLMCSAFASEYGTEADGMRALDAVRKMGRAQGYSGKRLASDAITMASVVGVQIRDDPSSIERNRTICRKLKLMD